MSDKLLIPLGAASVLLAIFAIVFAIKVLSRHPTPVEVVVLLSLVFMSAMGVLYTIIKFIGRKPPL
jgi:hypothetical protein